MSSRSVLRTLTLACLLAAVSLAFGSPVRTAQAVTTTVPHDLVPEIPDPRVTPKGMRLVIEPGRFEVCVPESWSRYTSSMGLTDAERGEYRVYMRGPGSADGVESQIIIAYYAPGNLIHKSVEVYLRRLSQPVLGAALEDDVYGGVRKETLEGREVLRFERDKSVYLPPRSLNARKIPVHERFVVIPATAGFYVLRMGAGLERKDEVAALFEKVLVTFRPLID